MRFTAATSTSLAERVFPKKMIARIRVTPIIIEADDHQLFQGKGNSSREVLDALVMNGMGMLNRGNCMDLHLTEAQ